MSERYIQQARLGPQQFPLNCPVKLSAGALLEDTKQPRLIGQLKFIPTGRMVTALSVTLHCQGETETDLPFRYEGLSAAPGQAFGQYTAVVLPAGTTAFQVTVEDVTFKGGSRWSRREAEDREKAKQEAAEKAAAMKAAAKDKMAQKKAEAQRKADEKQAANGAVPSDTQTAKGKGKPAAIVAAVLVAAIIAGAIFLPKLTKKDQPTVPALASAPVSAPASEGAPEAAPTPTRKVTPASNSASADLNETGDIVAVYIQQGENGFYSLTPDSFLAYFPEATTTSARMGPDLGDDVMVYLKDSFSFAWLIGSENARYGLSGDGTMYPQGSGDLPENVCVLAFDSMDNIGFKLVGYFIGIPEQYNENTIRIDLTVCDYDLSVLYEQERDAFQSGRDFLYENYIAPDSNFDALGAKYYIPGYHTCQTGMLEDDDVQAYHIWQEATSADHVDDFAFDIRSLKDRLSHNYGQSRTSTMFFLLLDKKYQPIGITWQ